MRLDCNTFILAFAVLLQSTVVSAEAVRESDCVRYGITRTVELQADNESGVPCRVLYHKPMEDQTTINLWNASNDAQFCSTKYDEFIIKLETRLNWSCELVNDHELSIAENNTPPELSTVMPDATDDKLVAGFKENVVEITPNELPVKRQRPEIARALPDEKRTQHINPALSMKRIEDYIPSGNYVSHKKESHSDNSPLCPADGFFKWSARSPKKLVFEMGADHEFQFDLTLLSDLPVASASKGTEFKKCQPKISVGYCSNEIYIGDTPLHPVLSSYFGCDGSSASPQNRRPLVLVRTLIDSNSSDSGCAISENYQHLALAPSRPPGEDAETTEKQGIELVILPKRTNSNSMNLIKGYVCQYVQGS